MGSCRTHLMNCASPSPSAVCLREWLFSEESTLPKYLLVWLLILPIKVNEEDFNPHCLKCIHLYYIHTFKIYPFITMIEIKKIDACIHKVLTSSTS